MAPKDVEKVEEKLEAKLTKIAEDLNSFKIQIVQRLTKLETIIFMAFGGNSIATIVLFILNLKK